MSNTPRTDHYRTEFKRRKEQPSELVSWLLDEFEQEEQRLAATQAALADSIRDHDTDSRRWAEVLRAQEGLTRIAEKERDQFKAKLVRYEQAVRELPEEPHGLRIQSGVVSYDYAVVQQYAIALRDYAVAQAVRADEKQKLLNQVPRLLVLLDEQRMLEQQRHGGNFGIAVAQDEYAQAWQQNDLETQQIKAAINAAIKGQKT